MTFGIERISDFFNFMSLLSMRGYTTHTILVNGSVEASV